MESPEAHRRVGRAVNAAAAALVAPRRRNVCIVGREVGAVVAAQRREGDLVVCRRGHRRGAREGALPLSRGRTLC